MWLPLVLVGAVVLLVLIAVAERITGPFDARRKEGE